MLQETGGFRIHALGLIPTPDEVINKYPVTHEIIKHVAQFRQQVENILTGKDRRLIVIIGPCSVHDTEAALDYAHKLFPIQKKHKNQLLIVMRTYFEKPRTVIGWKGLIADPNLDGSYALETGLKKARKLLLDINQLGLAAATEFLDMITSHYIADLISWGAVGARTTESPLHREMASALSCPIGFKNGTNGNIKIAIDAIRASRVSHYFYSPNRNGRMTVYRTNGNPYGHVILRGGKTAPNYDSESVENVCKQLSELNLPQRLVIDFSHANCKNEHSSQLTVAQNICKQIQSGKGYIAGIMAESFLKEGNQSIKDLENLTYGQSVTDPCLGWEDTILMLKMLARAMKAYCHLK
ncbi:phospho-2-dehydro-3-deoxyheptonate aldolase, Trp-sensitive [Candidatus Photodesmus blepharus]|uniref:Phospho-2-dehydro-3-deoxyheptonate aldolase n=1 Tax=Candidatus Photodesmus blepharonis TaxID=1179155 RepID=A0A084CM92_9GAMM|nr:3-deoxy-7-phosphoheptulonate synthase [Candidatus Photodesmus blepharus]KEY90921.1 phospho-2-dehydro-3-deoxyheptonate aldolase, Trp-sensitive [Candidatus Photodesmus blepharus]